MSHPPIPGIEDVTDIHFAQGLDLTANRLQYIDERIVGLTGSCYQGWHTILADKSLACGCICLVELGAEDFPYTQI